MRYFEISEFDSPDQPGSGVLMNEILLIILDKARELAKIPFKINSGYRTIEHNKAVGSSPTSSHLKGLAADISCLTNTQLTAILPALIRAGFTRIGIGRSFVHVDVDGAKPDKIWLYD